MSIWETKTIYSKRFPKMDIEQTLKGKDGMSSNNDVEEALQRFHEQIKETSTLPDDLAKVLKSKQMTELAISISELYEIDTDVVEGCGYVSVTMRLDYAAYMGELKERLAEMFCLCDDFAFFQNPQDGMGIILSLTCHSR